MNEPRQFLLGLVTYNVARDWDLDTLIRRCEEAGYAGVELRTTHAHGIEPSLDAKAREEVRKRFADTPVALVCLGTTCEFHSPDPEEVRRQIDLCGRFVDLAAAMGASAVKIRPNGLVPGEEEARTIERIAAGVRKCAVAAAASGIRVFLEVHGRDTCRPDRMAAIMQAANHPNAALCWNSNGTDVKDGSVAEAYDLLKPWIGHVHLHELSDPDYPYRELFRLLRADGYDGYTLAEAAESSEPERFLAYYRALWEALSDAEPL